MRRASGGRKRSDRLRTAGSHFLEEAMAVYKNYLLCPRSMHDRIFAHIPEIGLLVNNCSAISRQIVLRILMCATRLGFKAPENSGGKFCTCRFEGLPNLRQVRERTGEVLRLNHLGYYRIVHDLIALVLRDVVDVATLVVTRGFACFRVFVE